MKKIHRFLIEIEPKSDIFEVKERRIYSQVNKVLKMKPGENIIVFADRGLDILCEIVEIGKSNLILKRKENIDIDNEPQINLTAMIAITKGDNFGLVVQKLTELGVAKIVPIISDRTIKQSVKLERLRAISDEALELCGGRRRVYIEEPKGLEESFKNIAKSAVYFDRDGTALSIFKENDLTMYIGPEGGWSEREIGLFKSNDIKSATLGKRTLRAETAAIVAAQKILWN